MKKFEMKSNVFLNNYGSLLKGITDINGQLLVYITNHTYAYNGECTLEILENLKVIYLINPPIVYYYPSDKAQGYSFYSLISILRSENEAFPPFLTASMIQITHNSFT